MITAVTSVGRAVIKPRPDKWGDECRTAGALFRRTESLRPLAASSRPRRDELARCSAPSFMWAVLWTS